MRNEVEDINIMRTPQILLSLISMFFGIGMLSMGIDRLINEDWGVMIICFGLSLFGFFTSYDLFKVVRGTLK